MTTEEVETIEQHLKDLFEEEVWEAGLRLTRARVADAEGFIEAAACLREIAYDEAKHAFLIAEILKPDDVRDTRYNLKAAMEADASASDRERKFMQTAQQQGKEDVATLFHRLSLDEAEHVKKLEESLRRLGRDK